MSQPQLLLTVGEIARRLDARIHRIEYIIRSRDIQPIGWAGHARVFGEASFDRIAGELDRMDAGLPNQNHSQGGDAMSFALSWHSTFRSD